MPFDKDSLAKARSQGYTDDQIYNHLSQSDDRFRVAKQNGYSLDDVATHLTKPKGGEPNEDEITSKSKANSDRNAGREANEQVTPVGSEANVQANVLMRTKDQGQRQRNDQANLTDEGQTKDAQGGIQGTKEGEVLGSQVPARNKEEVAKGGVQAPARGFIEEIKTPQGRQAAVASALEEGIPMALGSVAAGIVGPAAGLASAPFVGPAAPVVGIGAGAATFLATQELAKKILVKPVESLLGIKEGIESAQAAAPTAAKYGGYAGMAPFAIESAAGFVKTGAEAAAKAAEGAVAKEVTKEVGKKAAAGFAGGVAFEPIRYGFESAEKGLGITDEAPKPMTFKSGFESGVMGMVLGGKVEEQVAKTEAGKNEIKSAGLPDTAEVAGQVKPDAVIKKEGEQEIKVQDLRKEEKNKLDEINIEEEQKKEKTPEVAVPEGARIKAAAYMAPDGSIYEGSSHLDAMENAKKAGAITQEEIDAKQDPESRNTSEFGFSVKLKDGSIAHTNRDGGEAVGKESGQVNLAEGEKPEHGMLHSHQTEMDDYPISPKVTDEEKSVISGVAEKAKEDMGRPGAAALEEFRNSRMVVGAEKIFEGKTNKDEWMQAMKDDGYNDENGFNDSVLNNIWRDSKGYVNDFESSMRGGDQSVKQTIKTAVTGKESVKPTIENLRATLRNSISKAEALGEYLRGMQKGAKYGKKAGIEEGLQRGQVKVEAVKQKLSEAKAGFEEERQASKKQADTLKVAQRWHDADKNAVRKSVDELLFKTIPESGLRLPISDLKTFSRQLDRVLLTPFNPRGGRMRGDKFVSTNEMMWERVDNLMKDIQQRADDVYASDLQKDIRGSVKKSLTSPSVFADFKDQIRNMVSGIDLKRLTPANEAKLRAKQEALAAEGKSLQASQAQRLLDLSKTDLKSLSIEELEALHNSILDAEKQGREKWASINEAKAAQEEQKLTNLAQDASVKPRNDWEKRVRDTGVSGYQKIKDKIYNSLASGRNWLSVHEKARMFIPDMFKVLDGKEKGWLYKNVYEPLITGIRQHGKDFNEVKEGAVDIAKKNDLSENDFVKIFVHAHKMQGKDEGELLKFSNDKENLSKIVDDYKQNGLTAGQKELYNYMRKKLDENVPSMLRFFVDNYNKQLKLYSNYFPRSFDNRKSAWWKAEENKIIDPTTGKEIDPNNVADGLMHKLEFPALTQAIRFGSAKERTEGAEIPLNLNAMEVFLNHMDDWHYVKNIQPSLNEAARMASSNVFAGKYGQVGKSLVLDYIDAMARRGKYARSTIEKGIDALRNISMVGTLGFRLSQFKHIANYPIGQKEAGGGQWWGRGLLAATRSQEGHDFIKKYMPEIFERSGGDVSVLEASRAGGKITKAAFIGDRLLDYHNAAATALGKYFHDLDQMGYNWKDFDKIPVNEELLNDAKTAVVRTVGSPSIVDVPLITSKGTSIGSKTFGKAFMAYQAPKMVRWGRLRNTITHDLLQNKNYGEFAKNISLLTASSALEAAVAIGSKKAYIAAAGALLAALGYKTYERKHEESALNEWGDDMIADAISTPPGGDVAKKFMQMRKYPQATAKIAAGTGVPPIDVTTGTLAYGLDYAFDPTNKEKAIKLGEQVAQFVGPTSSLIAIEKEGRKLLNRKKQANLDKSYFLKESGRDKKKKE